MLNLKRLVSGTKFSEGDIGLMGERIEEANILWMGVGLEIM